MKKVTGKFSAVYRIFAVVLMLAMVVSSTAFAAVVYPTGEFTENEQTGKDANKVQYPAESGIFPMLIAPEESFFTEISVPARDENGDEVTTDPLEFVKTTLTDADGNAGLGTTSSTDLGYTSGACVWEDYLITASVFMQSDDKYRNRINVYDVANGEILELVEWNNSHLSIAQKEDYYTGNNGTKTAQLYQCQDSIVDVFANDDYIFALVAAHGRPNWIGNAENFGTNFLELYVWENNITRNDEISNPTLIKKVQIWGDYAAKDYGTFGASGVETFMNVINGKLLVFVADKMTCIVVDVSSDASVAAISQENAVAVDLAEANLIRPTLNGTISPLRVTDVKFEGSVAYIISAPTTDVEAVKGGNADTYYDENEELFDIARIDFSRPENPVRLNGVSFECPSINCTTAGSTTRAVFPQLNISGDYAYVTTFGAAGGGWLTNEGTNYGRISTLRIFDFSDRDNLSMINEISLANVTGDNIPVAVTVVGNYLIGYGDASGKAGSAEFIIRLSEEKDNIEAYYKFDIDVNFEACAHKAIPCGDKIYIPYTKTGAKIATLKTVDVGATYNPKRAVLGVIDLSALMPNYVSIDSDDIAKNVAVPYTLEGRVVNAGTVYVSANGGEATEAEVTYNDTTTGKWSYTITEPGSYKIKVYTDDYPEYYDYVTVNAIDASAITTEVNFTATAADGVVTFTMTGGNGENMPLTGLPIAAVYSGELLVGATIGTAASVPVGETDYSLGTVEVTLPENTTTTGLTARLFFWNNITAIEPVISIPSTTLE